MANTQLPAEVVKRLEEEAEAYAGSVFNWVNGDKAKWDYLIFHYKQIATEYATKLHQAEQEIKQLKRWKAEASALLNPILEYGQSKEAGIPLGDSIPAVVIERCKRYDAASILLERIAHRHEGGLLPDRFLYNEIKTFLDAK